MSEAVREAAAKYQLIGPADDGGTSNLLGGMDDKESRQRLQALIAEWLRMENLVVLAGAGTSVSSGGKTMDGLERAVLGTLKGLPTLPGSIDKIIDARLASVGQGTESTKLGFEGWLSYLVNGHFIGSMGNSPFSGVQWKNDIEAPTRTDLEWFVQNVQCAIFAECALMLPSANDGTRSSYEVIPHLAFLSKLVSRDSNLGRSHLFTLNYDTLFEQALELLGIQYFDGFSGRADARFDPSVYGLDIYYPGEVSEGRVRRFDKFLHLYKLHGSIHWQMREQELRARHPDLAAIGEYHNLDIDKKAKKVADLAGALAPVGILPTTNKFTQTLTMPYAHLFRALQIRLSVPQTFLLVLGYGFGDDHVTRIIETALMNPSLVMLVVEPDPSSGTIARIRRYKELGKRAFVLAATKAAHTESAFKAATFDDFACNIMPDVQWLTDFLRLRRFEKQIGISETNPRITDDKNEDS